MEIFFLSHVNETMYLLWNLSFFKPVPPKITFWLITAQQTTTPINCFTARDDTPVPSYLKNAYCGRGGRWNSLSLEVPVLTADSFLTDIKPLAETSTGGPLPVPLLMSMSEAFSVPFYTLIKLCYTKALDWSSLVPGPEVKSSSEITNLTQFTISYQEDVLS